MAKKKDEYLVIPVEEKEMEERQSPKKASDQASDEMEEKFDKEFWMKVSIPRFDSCQLNIVYV